MRNPIIILIMFICGLQLTYAQRGKVDSSFGTNGIVKTDFGFINDKDYASTGKQVFMQNDGKIYVLIESSGQSYIAKRLKNGSPDVSYGNNGFSSPVDISQAAAAVQPDGKIVIAGNDLTKIDSSFSEDGKQLSDFGSEVNYASSVAIQDDGKIVVAGQTYGNTFSDFALIRFNTDGTPDNTFSKDGKIVTDFNYSEDICKSVAIQNDGKIIVSGYQYECNEETCGNAQFALARYLADGSLDATFNKTGKKITSFTSGYYATSMTLQTDGKIVMCGYTFGNNDADFAVVRFNKNGSLDNTFVDGGKVTTDINGSDFAYSVAVQDDGKIVAAGLDYGDNFDLTRYTSDGELDMTFGRGGKLLDRLRLNQGSTYYTSNAVQADGKLVVAGYTWNGSNYDFAVARYNANGALDITFSNDGKQTTDFASEDDFAQSVAIQQDGKIVLAGRAGGAFAVSRYNVDGKPDKSFGGDGKKIVAFGVDYVATANAIALQKDGKIVVAGYSNGSAQANEDFALARYNTDGSVDSGFGLEGKIITDLGFSEFANAVAIQEDGKIVAGGYSSINVRGESASFFALARYNTDGTIDPAFANSGKQLTVLEQFGNANAIAIQKDGKIIAAGFSSSSNPVGENFALARYSSNGRLDSSFGIEGVQITDLGSASEFANAVVIEKDGKIIAGGSSNGNFTTVAYSSNGVIDSSYGTNGAIITEASGQEDGITAMAIFNDKLYAVGYGQYPGFLGVIASYLISPANKPPVVSLKTLHNIVKYTGPATFKLAATATDLDGTISKVEFYNGSKLLHTETLIPYGFWWKNVPTGNYTVTAKAYDNSGNVVSSKPVTISVVSYNVPPAVSIVTPVANASYRAGTKIHFVAEARDANNSIRKVQFYNGTTLLRTENYYPYTYWFRNVQPGNYTITAVATDDKGLSTTSVPVSFIVVPNKAPTINIITPTNNKAYTGPATIRLEADAKDSDGTISKVEFYNGSTLLRTEHLLPYTYTWKEVPAGNYSIVAKATDNNGVESTSASVQISVVEVKATPEAHRPAPSADAAWKIAVYPNPSINTITIRTEGFQLKQRSTISIISTLGVVVKTVPSTSASMKIDISTLPSGVYTIKVADGDRAFYKQFVKL